MHTHRSTYRYQAGRIATAYILGIGLVFLPAKPTFAMRDDGEDSSFIMLFASLGLFAIFTNKLLSVCCAAAKRHCATLDEAIFINDQVALSVSQNRLSPALFPYLSDRK